MTSRRIRRPLLLAIAAVCFLMLLCCVPASADQQRFSVLASCAVNEFSSARTAAWSVVNGKLCYGCFTYWIGMGTGFFDDELHADMNGDERITLKELYEYTRDQVAADRGKSSQMTVNANSRQGNLVLFEYHSSSPKSRATAAEKKKLTRLAMRFTNTAGQAYYSLHEGGRKTWKFSKTAGREDGNLPGLLLEWTYGYSRNERKRIRRLPPSLEDLFRRRTGCGGGVLRKLRAGAGAPGPHRRG